MHHQEPTTALPPSAPIYARDGIGASSNPLVTEAGLEMLRNGGNAMDAVIAASAVMMCIEPRQGHLGGDAFCLIHTAGGTVHAMNGSGAAPAGATFEYYKEHGGFPKHGLPLASVPGEVALWEDASKRFGRKSLKETLARAIGYARRGIPVTPRLRSMLAADENVWKLYPSTVAAFYPDGRTQQIGEIMAQPLLATALERIVDGGAEEFYRGKMAREMIEFSQANGGLFAAEDFANHTNEFTKPLQASYRGYTVFEEPPPSPGILTLLTLMILDRFELRTLDPQSPERYHLLIEATKLAFEDRKLLGDPRFVDVPIERLLSDAHADKQAAKIDRKRARQALIPAAARPDTDNIVFGDSEGNVVAFIHSLYSSCAVTLGKTGVLMNGRMAGFVMDPASPNVVAPGKRPIHTLSNFLVHDANGKFALAGGTPGGNFQIQTNVQMITNVFDFGMSLTESIVQPRFTVGTNRTIQDPMVRIESRVDSKVVDELKAMGHPAETMAPWQTICSMQLVSRDPKTGVYQGATEIRRADNTVSGF